MPADESLTTLHLDWRDAGVGFGLPVKSRAWANIFDGLITRHDEPGRFYHRIEHVAAVLRALVELTNDLDPILVATAFFHDAIYDPERSDNEAMSAELAATVLPAVRVPDAAIAIITETINATSTHHVPANAIAPELCATFLDADLSILGAFPQRYAWYTEAIRAEYHHLDDDTFRTGRTAVLRSFLDRDQLYFTDAGRTAWEDSARRNLTREIASLQQGL